MQKNVDVSWKERIHAIRRPAAQIDSIRLRARQSWIADNSHVRRFLLTFRSAAIVLAFVGAPAAASEGLVPDVIYHNANIVTVDSEFNIAEAVAIRDGRIIAVGTDKNVRQLAASGTRQVNLNGKTILPGFYDNHIHLSTDRRAPNSKPEEWMFTEDSPFDIQDTWPRNYILIETPDELGAALKKAAAEIPEGDWIVGTLLRPYWHMKAPTRWEIDKYAPNHPVVLKQTHTMSVNSLALELAGITRTSSDPQGGHVVRNDRHEPVGILFERPARALVDRLIPPFPSLDEEQKLSFLRAQLEYNLRMGVTSVNVAGMRPNDLHLLQALYEQSGDVLPRLTVQLRIRSHGEQTAQIAIDEIESLGFRTNFGTDRLKIGALKLGVDGGWAAPAFWSTVPYPRPYTESEESDYTGVAIFSGDTLYRISKAAHDLGWQLGFHAIGDAAIIETVNVYKRVLKENPRYNHRHYVNHFGVLPPDSVLEEIADQDILVAQQPNFTYFNVDFMEAGLDGERLERNNPSASLLRKGIRLSYGSDGLPSGPLLGIWSAVTRRGIDGRIYGAEEGVTVPDAIRAYTIESAYLTFDENIIGSVEVGKAADLVVLSDNILEVDSEIIRDIAIERTIVGGVEVFVGQYVEPYYDRYPPNHTHQR